MKLKAMDYVAILCGIMFFILTSFVPGVIVQVMDLLNQGKEPGTVGWIVIFWVALLGAAMYLTGRFFRAFDKKLAKYFESLIEE